MILIMLMILWAAAISGEIMSKIMIMSRSGRT